MEKTNLVRAIEQAAEAIAITNERGDIQYVNPAFSRMTGYSAEEAIGQNPRVLKSGRHSCEFYANLWRTILDGRIWRGEVVNRRKDGSLYTEEMTIAPGPRQSGADGQLNRHQAGCQRARLAAEEERRFLASIVEFTGDAIFGGTPDGSIHTWNRAAEELFGHTAAEGVGQPASLLLAPGREEDLRQITQGLLKGEPARQFETVARRKDGSTVEVSLSASPHARPGPDGLRPAAVIVRDMTRQRQDQKALESSEERFRSAFEQAPVGVSLGLPDSRILQANGTFCRMLGYSEAELVRLGWAAITHPDDRHLSVLALDRLVRERPPCVEFEKRCIHADGHVLWGAHENLAGGTTRAARSTA